MYSMACSITTQFWRLMSISPIPMVRTIMFLRYSPWPPRPRNIKDQRFHTFEQADAYPALTAGYGARTA